MKGYGAISETGFSPVGVSNVLFGDALESQLPVCKVRNLETGKT